MKKQWMRSGAVVAASLLIASGLTGCGPVVTQDGPLRLGEGEMSICGPLDTSEPRAGYSLGYPVARNVSDQLVQIRSITLEGAVNVSPRGPALAAVMGPSDPDPYFIFPGSSKVVREWAQLLRTAEGTLIQPGEDAFLVVPVEVLDMSTAFDVEAFVVAYTVGGRSYESRTNLRYREVPGGDCEETSDTESNG